MLVALGLSGLLAVLVYSALSNYWRLSTLGRLDIERTQIARTLMRRISNDLGSTIYRVPVEQTADDSQAAEDDSDDASSVPTVSAADEDDSMMPAVSSSSSDDTESTVMQDSDLDTLTMVDLIGDMQSITFVALRPTRQRGAIVSLDDEIISSESDLRRITYMFSAGVAGNVSGAGLFYSNTDQRAAEFAEQEGGSLVGTEEYELLASELSEVTFQYYDGGTGAWVQAWNSRDMGGLPRAVKISMRFHPSSMSSSKLVAEAETSASTEVFQSVVYLPVSPPAEAF